MIALVLLAALGGIDSLGPITVGPMRLKAPVNWSMEVTEDGTKSWTSPDQKGAMSFYSGSLEKVRPPKACVDALVSAVGLDGFEFAPVAAQPAAKKVTNDFIGTKPEDKTEENRVITTTILGCDGKTKWLLTFTSRKSQAARFGPILRRVLESVSYGK